MYSTSGMHIKWDDNFQGEQGHAQAFLNSLTAGSFEIIWNTTSKVIVALSNLLRQIRT